MSSGHGHSHGIGHGHGQDAGPSDRTIRRMGISLAVLGAFLLLEAGVGLWIGSLALLADAGHMLTDVVGVSMGMVALVLARRGSAAAARTFGWHRARSSPRWPMRFSCSASRHG